MCRFKNMLAEWLNNANSPSNRESLIRAHYHIAQNKTRRKRAYILEPIKQRMEQHFAVENRPSRATMARLSKEWELDYKRKVDDPSYVETEWTDMNCYRLFYPN
ncbi:hypothetical protein KIN20_020999 [Parelaphostrongylus tenuis]|uniref:Uncharacterized protein n=1 Tax=Parelaphostrongylus tenuis TaxID=148309 RepID=A0AAD5QU39_PARTN|nr:hypothetical protein KIN20_020999 [Parelaphostrongylus tenuis]